MHFQKQGIHMTIIMSYRTSPRSGLFKTIILQQNTITKWSNQKYVVYSYQGQCLLKNAFLWYLKRFGISKNIWKTMSLKNAFWQRLKRFGIAEIFLKTMPVNNAFWRYLERIENFEINLLNVPSDGIWNDFELQRQFWKQCF